MRWAVGVDLEEVAKFERALRNNRRFFARVFSKSEIRYCNSKAGPARHFAGTFAAKEAVVKAVNQPLRKTVKVSEVGIVRSKTGVPSVRWFGAKPKGLEVRVSISHTTHYAVAVALAMLRE
ncbi:MAG TPA: holo-ACP synthase [Nitrososphaerales archaeon]|nr:holo-ACP synthase [Nitrososphaerales archaeon]